MNGKSNKILVVVDLSYWLYYTIFGSVSEFQKKSPLEAKVLIKDAELTDQSNLPDLTTSDNYRRILKKFVIKRLDTIDWQLRGNFQDEIDSAEGIDYIFAMDDYVKNNFRKSLYPEYKAQRRLAKKSYNMYKIQQYVLDVVFKELDLENSYHYHLVRVDGAEGDDVIATIFKNIGKDYMLNVLFASDRDFIQLDNVHQLNLFGQKVEPKLGNELVTPAEYLLAKIILGDSSDNIKKVFPKVGDKKALKLVKDKQLLRQKLSESQDSARRFMLNKKLISFNEIPSDLTQKILEKVNQTLYEDETLNSKIDFKTFMMM